MLAVLQLRATADVAANIAQAARLVRKAAAEYNADFICLPEAFDYIVDFSAPPELHPRPEPLAGERIQTFRWLARECKVWLSLGGVHEARDDGKQHNSHVILDDNGDVRAVYRKIHLFDANVENGFHESRTVTPGSEIIVVKDTPIGNVGLSTCYDMRFPSMFAAMRDAGAEVVLVPSAFTMVTGAAHWHTLLRARAIENQVYVAAAAQVGPNNASRSSYGHSLIVDPFGLVTVDLGGEKEDAIGLAQIDRGVLQQVRNTMPVQEHRRKADGVISVVSSNVKVL